MPKFKTKPVKIEHVEAILDGEAFIVQPIKDGKPYGTARRIDAKLFKEQFVEIKRARKNGAANV